MNRFDEIVEAIDAVWNKAGRGVAKLPVNESPSNDKRRIFVIS